MAVAWVVYECWTRYAVHASAGFTFYTEEEEEGLHWCVLHCSTNTPVFNVRFMAVYLAAVCVQVQHWKAHKRACKQLQAALG
jgi:hypothetical protein